MTREVTPVWGIETYYKDPTFYPYIDNNRVPIDTAAKVFESYSPCTFISHVNEIGGLGMAEQVIFTETDLKPLPSALKDGIMGISDVFPVIIKGPGMKQGKEYEL